MKYASLILVAAGCCSGCAIYTSDGYSYGRSSSWRPRPPVVVHSEPATSLPTSSSSLPPPRPPSSSGAMLPPPTRPPYVAAPPYAQNLPSDRIDISSVPLDSGHKGHRKGKAMPMKQNDDW